jgi:hypothetical protein
MRSDNIYKWFQQHKLVPNNGAKGISFGSSVSISGDTALVGAPKDNDKGLGAGSAYIYTIPSK